MKTPMARPRPRRVALHLPDTAEWRMLRPAPAPVPQAALLHVFAVADDTWNGREQSRPAWQLETTSKGQELFFMNAKCQVKIRGATIVVDGIPHFLTPPEANGEPS
jgi:hypothetical protein